MLSSLQVRTVNYVQILGELIDNQLESFRSLYLNGREICNLIVVDDYVSRAMKKLSFESDVISYDRFKRLIATYRNKSVEHIALAMGLDEESAMLLPQSIVLIDKIAEMMKEGKNLRNYDQVRAF